MDCPDLNRLSRFANGLLLEEGDDGDDAASLAAHAADCASCRDRVARLRAAFAFPSTEEPPAHVLPELLRKVGDRLTRSAHEHVLGEGGEGKKVVMEADEPVGLLGGAVGTSSDPSLPALPPVVPPVVEEPVVEEPVAADNEWEASAAVEPATDDVAAEVAPEGPETISQKEAEDIIRRITSKAAVVAEAPPEEKKPTPLTLRPRASGWGRMVALVPLFLLAALMVGVVARDELTPELSPMEGRLAPGKTSEQVLEEKFRAKVLESEWRAFGYASRDEFENDRKKWASSPEGEERK